MEPAKIKILFVGLLVLAVLIEVSADILFKKWSLEGRNILFILGMVVYALGTCFWALSLKFDYLSKAVSIFTVLNLIGVILVGVIMFNEKLTLVNKIGIGLGIISVILLEL